MERASKSSEERNMDRLSDLPDGVICHILSFLETKRSVQTSVLAKRWRTLWAHVPFINLQAEDAMKTTFSGIVCTVLLRHKAQSLNSFRLTCGGDDDDDDDNGTMGSYELETCIATVVERNVQNLYLGLVRVEVPRCLLTCNTLVDLTIIYAFFPSSGPIYLPNLKKLHLWDLYCEVNFTCLLSGCPVLEELIIDRITCADPRGCYISSPTLKRLTIIFLLDCSMFDNPYYMVTINTPALRYLRVNDFSSKHFSISLCAYLVEAGITMYSSCVLKFLDSIRNVKCLQLTGSCDEICDNLMSGSIAKFGNLTKLELCADWRLLSNFLESADHLQVLIIHGLDDSDSKHWKEPTEERCACLFYSLRTVRITHFRCTEQGFNMVRYILRNAQVLKLMEIDFQRCEGDGLKEIFYAILRISLFRRGSEECELAFS